MLKKAERTFTFTSSGGYRTGFGRLYTANFPEKTGLNKKLRIPFFCILTGFIFFSFVINMGYSVSYGQNEVKSVQDTRMTKKVYYPRNCDAGSLGNRLVNFLPGDIRARTEWSVDSTKKALTIIGPEQAITIADQLIPRMDASVQLVDRHVDVGVIDKPVPEKPVLSNADAALLQGERDVSPRYYDPDKNQYVRVAYQADNAVMPDNNEQPLFGSGQSGNLNYENGSGNRIASQFGMNIGAVDPENEDVPDIQAYACPINVIAQVNALLERQYGNNQNIMIKMDPQIGKILVHATRRNQRVVQQFLAGLNIYPSSSDDQVTDPRIELGIVRPAAGMPSGNNYQNGRNTADISIFVPVNRSLADIESLLTRLFENRLEKFSNNTGVDVPYTERQKVVYRFTRRKTSYDQRTRFCDLEIDPLNNRISISGDQALCYQMNQLLTTMDQQPSKKGNVRRFISIRNSDSQIIKDVIEQEHQVPQSIYWNQNNNGRVPRQVIFWNKNRKPADLFPVSELEVAIQRINQNPAGLARIENQEERLAASEQTGNSNQVSQVSYTGEDVHQDSAVHSADYQEEVVDDSRHGSHIRQIAYQDDSGAGLNPVGPPALEPNMNPGAVPEMNPNVPGGVPGMNPGVGPGNPFRNGVGVVQDYIPQVLTDLDVVIVDAPESEFERIKKMIEQIEELAKLAEPKTEIYFLKNINCVMLNGLLDELYTQIFATKQGRVMLYPMQTPNALFLAGWGDAFDSMKNLIDFFDQPLETNGSMLQVIHLKYISASETAEQLMTFFPTVQPYTGGFSPKIRVYADVRSNSLIVHAAANDLKQIQDLLVKLDVNKAETKLMTRIFPLKYSLAEDIRTTIMNAILPAREGTLETTAAKYPILEILSVDETGRKLIESGIMMDVDISADVYHQQLIVNAPEDCMPFMEELIRLLDVAPKRAQIRFFQVKNGDATQIVETLRSLLATDDNPTSMPTIPQAEGEEAFVPVRFALDTRTNVIIAAAGPKDLAVIDALILALDVKDTQERKEKVVQLRNVQALRIAQAIDDYLAQKQEMEIASGALSEYQLVESQVIVIPESITNSIIVSAAPEYLDQIVEMINSFDKEPPQVMIQVLIAEVMLSNQEEFGIETGFQNSTSFDRSLITTTSSGSTGDPGFDMLNGSGPGQNMNAVNNVKDIAGQVLNDFGMGADSNLGFGGFIVSASSRSIQLTLRALRQKNRLQVLSRPQITAMDNQQAFILVGQRVPRIKGTTMTNYGTQTDTQDTPVGLILLVTPRVSADGQVIMEIGAEKSSLGSDSDAVPIYASGNTVIKSPSIDTIQAMTAISAHDGETVMLGGLLTSSKEKISSGVPYLSDIPLLGWFFRYDQEVETRKELLIVMTPRILNKQEDFEEVKRVEAAKMSWVLDDAMALHGNMGLFDPMSGNGMSTKRTRSLVNDLVHMDHMDELETKPGYSPSRDYKDKTDREYELDHDAMNKNIGLPDKEENFIKQPERANRPVSESREQDTSDKRQKLFLTTEPEDEGGGQWQNGNTPQQNDFRLNDDFRLNNDNQSNLLQQSRRDENRQASINRQNSVNQQTSINRNGVQMVADNRSTPKQTMQGSGMFRDEDWSVWSVDMAKPERPAPSTNFISLANPDGRHTDQRSQSTPVMFNNGGLKAVETNNSPKTYTFDALDNVQQSQWQNLHQEKSSVYLSEIPEPHYR